LAAATTSLNFLRGGLLSSAGLLVSPPAIEYSKCIQPKGAPIVARENALSVYISRPKAEKRPMERLAKLAERHDRSINYLIVEAILQYLDREESKR